MLVYYGCTPTRRLHTGLCKFVQNISTNIWSLGKRTDLKFGEIPSLFISYNIIISWLYTVNGFRIIFLLRDSANQELKTCLNYYMFLEPIELLGSKSDSGNMKRHPIGPAFSKNSTACTRGFSRRSAVFRRSRREKPLTSRVTVIRIPHSFAEPTTTRSITRRWINLFRSL